MKSRSDNCPDCGSHNFFLNKERGELICRECSCVLDDALVDFGRDSRAFDDDEMTDQNQVFESFDSLD